MLMEVEAVDHVDYVCDSERSTHPEQCCEPHFLSPLLAPFLHVKPHLKCQRRDEGI